MHRRWHSPTRHLRMFAWLVALAGLGSAQPVAEDGEPVLVKDIVLATQSSDPASLTVSGGRLYFTALDEATGRELWRTDGTGAGAVLVKDIEPGPAGSYPDDLTDVGGTLFFTASDDMGFRGLWKTDGTAAGTVLVKAVRARRFFDVDGRLFFWGDDGVHGEELWTSDGTTGGTRLVLDITEGPWGSQPGPMAKVNGRLFFWVRSWAGGCELWTSNGTAAGTRFVYVFFSQPSSSSMASLGDTLVFAANDGRLGVELWRSNGTRAGTSLVAEVQPGPEGSNPDQLTAVDGAVLFAATGPATGRELWRTEGTTASTAIVSDIWPGPFGSIRDPEAVGHGGMLFFLADDGESGEELWRSDGTEAGTTLVRDIGPGSTWGQVSDVTVAAGGLFFVVERFSPTPSLWTSDGTAAGTRLVRRFGAAGVADGKVAQLTGAAAALFFVADDGTLGREPWVSDGTEAGTRLVADVNTRGVGSDPTQLTAVGSALFFTPAAPGLNRDLWRSDGTAGGTALVRDLWPWGGPETAWLTDVNGVLFFSSDDGERGRELWRSDGTPDGTRLVGDLCPGSCGSYPRALVKVGGTLLFWTDGGTPALWRSDGTAAGTVLVQSFTGAWPDEAPIVQAATRGTLYFWVERSGVEELWRSDGTTGGTVLIAAAPAGATVMTGQSVLVDAGSTVFYQLRTSTGAHELWKTDGTAAGTVRVREFGAGGWSDPLSGLTSVGGILYFAAHDSEHGRELWRSDGTTAGTVIVADIEPGPAGSNPAGLVNRRGTLVFWARTSAAGEEPWRSDGTEAGTTLVKDIWPGSGGSGRTGVEGGVAVVNGTVYFQANDGIAGNELWQTDGTAAGTRLVGDILAGPNGAEPMLLTAAGAALYFTADDRVHGRELWKAPVPPPQPPRLHPVTGPLTAGGRNVLYGSDFTPGSVVKLYVATPAGPVAYGPYPPAGRGADWIAWTLPAEEASGPCAPWFCLGNGFAAVQVINTDEGFLASNVVGALLLGEASAGFPSITHINTLGLAPPDPGVSLAHIDTAVPKGFWITVEGTGFADPVVNLFAAAGNVGPLTPMAGATATRLQVLIPVGAPTGPGTFQVVNRPSYRVSNAVAAVIGRQLGISSVSVTGSTITVTGTGFSPVSVVNLFNRQGDGVVNLGGYGPGGLARIPLAIASDTLFTFERPAGAEAGPAFLEVLNPPFIPFASSGADPDGAFTMPAPAPEVTRQRTDANDLAAASTRDAAASAAARAASSRETVRWTRAAGAVADGSTLRMLGVDDLLGTGSPAGSRTGTPWAAGARSTRALVDGDGDAAWTVGTDATDLAFGLSTDDTDGTLADIDHAWRLDAATRELQVWERGTRQARLGTWAAGDRLRVGVRGDRVEYWRNDVLAWTSTHAPRYPLVVDASLGAPGATLRNVRLAGRLGTVVEWPAQDGVAAGSMRATATGAPRGAHRLAGSLPAESGAARGRRLALGVPAATLAVSANLRGDAAIGFGTTGCDYCLVRRGDVLEVRHAGIVRGAWSAVAARCRVEIDAAGVVRYWADEVRLDEAPLGAADRTGPGVRGWLGTPGAAIAGAIVTEGPGR